MSDLAVDVRRWTREVKRAYREGDVDRAIVIDRNPHSIGVKSFPAWQLERELNLGLAPPCSSCGGRCVGGDDGLWRCVKCGDEWCADHHPVYS